MSQNNKLFDEVLIDDVILNHHTILVNDIKLHYVIAGSGDPLVLLHGWPQTWYAWKHVIPALAEHYTVIAPDLRGFGDSDKPAGGFDKKTLADDIYKLVHKLGFEQIYLVGHDIGGMVAYAYAAEHPEDVRKLVLMDLLLPGVGLEEVMDVSKGGYWHFGWHMVRDLPEALISGRERIYLSHFFRELSYNPNAISDEDIDEYVRCYSSPGALRCGFETYRTLLADGEQNKKYATQKLQMPVQAYGGQNSAGDMLYQSLLTVADNVSSKVIEGCGHYIPEERPDVFVQELITFLNK
ncbi:alpha/beta hydrolase [Priestia megaterium]|uniref:alpha/beta fold hydrolase n=1 Tax=Priestia megaterium TaxID=1404 RepID=UPI002E2483AD|nr:alpha/beta hydrolase [Priestia megaterium]MED4292028.1 alpha/beta hydrolase [Priestia megaterium]